MFKRLFFGLLGLGAGLALGAYAIKKVETTTQALTPGALADAATQRAGGFADRISAAVEEGRAEASRREAELRASSLGRTATATDPAG